MTQPAIAMVSIIVLCCSFALADSPAAELSGETILETLQQSHPRLILTDDRVAEIKQAAQADELLAKCIQDVMRRADATLRRGKLKHATRGKGPSKMLKVSRDCLARMYAMGLAWRLTGKEIYAEKIKENLLTVCAFPDWDPDHFLDVAEMTHAVAIGYDWTYSYLDEDSRAKIRAGLIRNGLEPGLAAYRGQIGAAWVKGRTNWTLVCNGGLVAGCLAIAETDPQYAREILPAAAKCIARAIGTYDPDGAWSEGVGYWNYATKYAVVALASMRTALGKDFGLSDRQGLEEAGTFPIYMVGSTNRFFNYADDVEYARPRRMPTLFWLARRYNRPEYAALERALLGKSRASPEDVIWYQGAGAEKAVPRKLDKLFRGDVPVAIFRSSWSDPNALFLAAKAGSNYGGHNHLDLGTFVLDALGERWVLDLGREKYSVPSYFDMETRGGKRWTYYRTRSESHNVPLINNRGQDFKGTAAVVKFDSKPDSAFVIIDLTKAYLDFDGRCLRGLAVTDGRRAVLVQDEFELSSATDLAWGVTTDASIELAGDVAILRKGDKALQVKILAPAGANFTIESALQKPPETTNKGKSRLMIRLKGRKGHVRVAVQLAPIRASGKVSKIPDIKPLAKW